MQCQVCKQDEATVHLTQIVDDDVRSLDLCEGCAKHKGVSDPLGFSFADVFKEVAAEGAATEEDARRPARAARSEVQCSQCGLTHAEFKKTGRLGCSDCYEAFGEILDSMLKGMHKGIRHTGKVPVAGASPHGERPASGPRAASTAAVPTHPVAADVDRLSALLAEAVAREDFEAAARLRDQIRAAKTTPAGKDVQP